MVLLDHIFAVAAKYFTAWRSLVAVSQVCTYSNTCRLAGVLGVKPFQHSMKARFVYEVNSHRVICQSMSY